MYSLVLHFRLILDRDGYGGDNKLNSLFQLNGHRAQG